MSFYVGDAITGRTLDEGAPVVAFLVNYQGGKYPLHNNPNARLTGPADRFSLESLPIFGTAADCGRIEPDDEDSLAVRLALRMAACDTWDQFSKTGLHARTSIQLLGQDGEQFKRTYGLCTMHRETYEFLVGGKRTKLANGWCPSGYTGLHLDPVMKAVDVERVLALLTRCMQEPAATYIKQPPQKGEQIDMEKFMQAHNLARLCMLTSDHQIFDDIFPGEVDVPLLMWGLGSQEGRLFGADFHALTRTLPFIGQDLMQQNAASAAEVEHLREFLELLWDCRHLDTRVDQLNSEFRPSIYSSQDRNYGQMLEVGRHTLESVWSELVDVHLDCYGAEDHIQDLDDELARMEATVAKMRERLAQGCRDADLPS